MPSTITTTAEYTATAPTFPVDGEDLEAADVEATVQTALNRAHYARGGLWGQLLWSGRFAVAPGGTSTVFAVTVGAISSLCVRDATGTWRPYYVAAETTLTLAHVEGAPAALSNSTWHYVYAYSDGTTTLRFIINTTAPDATGLWQSAGGDALRRYLGCFRTTSGGAPIPVRAVRGVYRYDISEIAAAALQALNITSAVPTSFTNIDCSALIPPHSRLGCFRIEMTNADTTNWGRTELRKDGASTDVLTVDCPPAGSAQSACARENFELVTSTAQVIEYRAITSGGRADCDISVQVLGFTE